MINVFLVLVFSNTIVTVLSLFIRAEQPIVFITTSITECMRECIELIILKLYHVCKSVLVRFIL